MRNFLLWTVCWHHFVLFKQSVNSNAASTHLFIFSVLFLQSIWSKSYNNKCILYGIPSHFPDLKSEECTLMSTQCICIHTHNFFLPRIHAMLIAFNEIQSDSMFVTIAKYAAIIWIFCIAGDFYSTIKSK